MKARTLAASLLATAVACGDGEQTPASSLARPVVVAPVVVEDVKDRIEATGELLAPNQADIAAEVSGRITEMLVNEGSPVAAGQLVLSIDPGRRRLEIQRTRARMGEAEAELRGEERDVERIRRLRGSNVASQTQLEQAETQLQLARSRLEAARAEAGVAERALRDANVDAPFAGLVVRHLVSRGEFVSLGQKLFELVSLDPVEVEFYLAEVDSGRVRLGQNVDVRVAPHPGEVFRATVSVISPTIDPRTRTLRVKATLPNGDGRLRPGLFARADLGVAERKGVKMIPEEAILQRSDGSVVYRMRPGNRVERVVVETGVYRNGTVEVRSGLDASDRVVTRGQSYLIDGAVVVPRDIEGLPLAHDSNGAPATVGAKR